MHILRIKSVDGNGGLSPISYFCNRIVVSMNVEDFAKGLSNLTGVPGQLNQMDNRLAALESMVARLSQAALQRLENGVSRDFHDFASLDSRGLADEADAVADATAFGSADPSEIAALLRVLAQRLRQQQ